MPQSMFKFFSDRGGPGHGGALHWPGTPDGFPFRGETVPDLRQEEAEQLPLVLDYHSKLFRMDEPGEKAEFDSIMDRIVNGWYMLHRRHDEWVQDRGPVIWLEWVQIYGELPNSKHPLRATQNVQPRIGGPQRSALL